MVINLFWPVIIIIIIIIIIIVVVVVNDVVFMLMKLSRPLYRANDKLEKWNSLFTCPRIYRETSVIDYRFVRDNNDILRLTYMCRKLEGTKNSTVHRNLAVDFQLEFNNQALARSSVRHVFWVIQNGTLDGIPLQKGSLLLHGLGGCI